MAIRDVTALLTDGSLTWTQRRTRLQGWRGHEAACADAAPLAQRIGPAVCATGAAVGTALESPATLGVFALTALVGAFAPNHPFEAVYNGLASTRGWAILPPNRAAKRLGCAIGAAFLAGAAVSYALGSAMVGSVLAIVLMVMAAFVAVTGVCVPSIVFTMFWGSERAAACRLVGRRSAGALQGP